MSEARILNLVLQAQSGDRDAFGELAEIFEPTVFAVALRKLRNRSEAREVTQDVLIQAFRKLPQLREPERFAGWLRQIANRMSINRAVRGPNETMRSPETFDTVRNDPDTPLDGVLRDERAHQVRDGLSRLRDLDRDTFVAKFRECCEQHAADGGQRGARVDAIVAAVDRLDAAPSLEALVASLDLK